MKRISTMLLAAAIGATILGPAAPAVAHEHAPSGPAAVSGKLRKQLAKIRRATAKYRDVEAAIADGYAPSDVCAQLPGVGGMGYHYVNVARLADGVIDPAKPEILVYVPTAYGPKLGAVEYAAVDADQDTSTADDRPALFGVPFDGPMPGHGPGEPVHYDLHVWVWKRNPAGVFAAWNPRVSCPQG